MKTKKQSLNKTIKTGILIFGISLLLWNCKQDQEEVLEILTIEHAIPQYSQRMIGVIEIPKVEKYLIDKLPKNTFERNNEDSGIFINYNDVLETVDSLENTSYSIRFTFDDSPAGEFFNLVVGETVEGELGQPSVLGFVCDEEHLETFVAQHYDMNHFKGTISLYNYLDFFSETERLKRSRTNTGDINIEPCDNQSYTGSGGDPYDYNNPAHWDPIDPEGTGGGSGLEDIDTSSGGGGCTWTTGTTGPCDEGGHGIHSPSSCGAGTGVSSVLIIDCGADKTVDELGCGDPISFGINSEEDVSLAIMKKIESSELDPCSDDILTELKGLQQNNIAEILDRFDSPDSAYDWEIKNGTTTNPDNVAETDWKRDSNNVAQEYNYETIIKQSYVNQATNLAIARTILHETIHAYILSYTDDIIENNIDTNTIQSFQNNFPEVWNYYVAQQNGIEVGELEDAHHEQIAATFIDVISDALAEFDDNQQSNSYYNYLAWGALFETDAWSSAIQNGNISSTEADNIINANNQEDTNGASANGSPCS